MFVSRLTFQFRFSVAIKDEPFHDADAVDDVDGLGEAPNNLTLLF